MVLYLPNTQNSSLNMRKTSHKSPQSNMLQNIWSVLLNTVKAIKHKKNLRNHQSQEAPEETQQLHVMWCPGWDPAEQEDIR